MPEQQFNMRPDGFSEIRKTLILRALPVSFVAVFGGLCISYFSAENHSADYIVYPIIIPLILVALAVGIGIGIKRQKGIYDSYSLVFDGDHITREQINTPVMTIAYGSVTSITKNTDGSFAIKADSAANVVLVPAQIGNYEELEKLLNGIMPVTIATDISLTEKLRIPLVILVIGLMMATYLATGKIVVTVCGVSTLLILAYSFIEIQRNKNIDSKTKRNSWLTLLVALSILRYIWVKLYP